MLKLLLPAILVLILIGGGLIYWRFSQPKNLETPTKLAEEVDIQPVEVSKSLPEAPVEDKVKTLEDSVQTLASEINNLKKSAASQTSQSNSSLDSRLKNVEAAATELTVRVANLEKASPAPASGTSSKTTVYIPLGAGGSWADVDWHSLTEYEISLNPDNFPLYTGMSLEITFRLVESAGIGSVRLYNVSDSSSVSGQLDTTSTSFNLQSSSSFKLPSGTKTYRLQVKSTGGKDLFIQSARIKVSF